MTEKDSLKQDIDLSRILRKRWPLIAFGLCIGLTVGVIYQLNARHVFESRMEILVGQRSSELATTGSSINQSIEGSILREDVLATHMELLRSPLILNTAIATEKLDELPSFVEAKLADKLPLEHLQGTLSISRGGEGTAKQASVLKASFRDYSAADAAKVLQAVYDSYASYIQEQTKTVGGEAIKLIEEAQVKNEMELQEATKEYKNFVAKASSIMDGEELKSVHHERLKDLEKELTQVRSSLATSTSRLQILQEAFSSRSEQELSDLERLALLSENEVERLKLFMELTRGEAQSEAFQADQPLRAEAARTEYNRLLTLILREQTLTSDFGNDHPLVQSVRQEISSIKQFISANSPGEVGDTEIKKMSAAEMLEAYSSLLSNDISELTKRLVVLEKDAETERKAAKGVEEEFLLGRSIRAKMDRAQQRYDEVMKRLQEISLTSNYAGFSTDLLSAPVPPQRKAWPNALIVLAIGACAGLMVGLALAFVAESSDRTFRDPNDLQTTLGAPILAHVPRFVTTRRDIKQAKDSSISPNLRTFHAPRAIESEVYRMARTALLFQGKLKNRRVFLITSATPSDGKSTCAANIAVSAAQAGKKVLIVDADLRRPTLHSLFRVPGDVGLADYLRGDCEFDEVVNATAQPNLNLVHCGLRTEEPAELLESMRLSAFIAEARESYDLIIFDSPPLLAVADPVIIAPQVDSLLMVVRIQSNARRIVERARKIIADCDVELAGIVVNCSEKATKNFGYGEYVAPYEYGYETEYTKQYAATNSAKDRA